MNTVLKYFCYPIHLSLLLTKKMKDAELRAYLLIFLWLILLLILTIINCHSGAIGIIYLIYALHLYDKTNYIKINSDVN